MYAFLFVWMFDPMYICIMCVYVYMYHMCICINVYYVFLSVWVFAFMYVCTPEAEEGIRAPRSRITSTCEQPCGCWQWNVGPRKEQSAISADPKDCSGVLARWFSRQRCLIPQNPHSRRRVPVASSCPLTSTLQASAC